MNREIKNDGIYVEVNGDELIDNLEQLKSAQVVVVKKVRIEMAGEEKDSFVRKFEQILDIVKSHDQYKELTSKQQSDLVLRSFLV